ncbi:MAG TPA: UDP-N-acetylmuramate--L-alanine ligase [Oscillatoriaceae cyanobacterium]
MNIPTALHFVGIGGMGMSAIAQVWHAKGRPVTGSDAHASATLQRLGGYGIGIHVGHSAEYVGQAEALVVSTAVNEENPEVKEARRLGLPVLHRSEVLGALMREKTSIAVTGTHGKTTTSAMVASVLLEAGVDPTVLLGGELPYLGGNARAGEGPFLVAEADESDKSIRNLFAEIAILTNLESDHLDHYKDVDEIIEVMLAFINSLGPSAKLVACSDDPGVRRLLPHVRAQVVTYGWGPEADFRIEGEALTAGGSTFRIGEDSFALQVPGRHNIANATAAIAACRLLCIDTGAIAAGLASFTGVKRRFQTIGSVGGVTVIDDYAHHPSEIRATLQAAKLLDRPVHAVFQPHRHSRLEALLNEFAQSFGGVASVTVMETYSAGEAPRQVNSGSLASLIQRYEPGLAVQQPQSMSAAVTQLADAVKPGDLVLLLGAGDIHTLAQPLLAAIEARLNLSAQTA